MNFDNLINTRYEFHVSEKRKIKRLILDFSQRDFFHLAGFQHLTDIALPRNRNTTIKDVLTGKITEQILSKSKHYVNSIKDDKNIRDRICELRYLEEYLDVDNMIKIFSIKDTPFLFSDIIADYVIESSISKRNKTVYIFLKERSEKSGTYCVVSFFTKKEITYGGQKLYWMLKKKIVQNKTIILYKHENYNEKSIG